MPYSPRVLDYFQHPRGAVEVAAATSVVEASNPVCGDVLKLWVYAPAGVILNAGFKAQGCVPAVACGSWFAEWLEGRELSDLGSLTAADVEKSLGGLPEASRHAAALTLAVRDQLLCALKTAGP